MVKTVVLGKIKKGSRIAKEFPRARYMDFGGRKYETLSIAKEKTYERFLKRRYAKPKIVVVGLK